MNHWGSNLYEGAMADGVSGSSSTVKPTLNQFTADKGYGFKRNWELPLGEDLFNWLGTGPTPSSAGGAATAIGSGLSTLLPSMKNSGDCKGR
jgi:hypothetical protein